MRKLASIRLIDAITPINGADAIECVTIGGWKCVAKKGEFQRGQLCVYFEVDSILPSNDARYAFLAASFKDVPTESGTTVNGHRLKTIKLRGQISQGLALPLSLYPEVSNPTVDDDLTALLKIEKYELLSSNGSTAGRGRTRSFPAFIIKSDQERCQNISKQIFADMDKQYEVTQKLDGQSATYYYRDGIVGLCSRNMHLGVPDGVNPPPELTLWEKIKGFFNKKPLVLLQQEPKSNWHKAEAKYDIFTALKKLGMNIALQGEIIAPTIQGGYEKVPNMQLRIYAVQNLDSGTFVAPDKAHDIVAKLNHDFGCKLEYVPVLHKSISLAQLGITNIDELLKFAEGASILNPEQKIREGVVFKAVDGSGSFKVINNLYLLKNDKKD